MAHTGDEGTHYVGDGCEPAHTLLAAAGLIEPEAEVAEAEVVPGERVLLVMEAQVDPTVADIDTLGRLWEGLVKSLEPQPGVSGVSGYAFRAEAADAVREAMGEAIERG